MTARERLAAWVREEANVTDPDVSPNHAWRHTFKRRAARAGIEANIRDGMCGHSYRTVADMYEAPSVETAPRSPALQGWGGIGAPDEVRVTGLQRYNILSYITLRAQQQQRDL